MTMELQVSPYAESPRLEDFLRNSSLYIDGAGYRQLRLAIYNYDGRDCSKYFWNSRIVTRSISSEADYYSWSLGNDNSNEPAQWVVYRLSDTVRMVASFDPANIFKKRIVSLYDKLYPAYSRIFLNTNELLGIFENIEDIVDNPIIRVKKISTRTRLSDYRGRPYSSSIVWSDKSYREVAEDIRESNEWVRSIGVAIEFSDQEALVRTEGTVARDGLISCKHNFRFFYYLVVKALTEKASRYSKLFANRSRDTEETATAKPLVVKFRSNIFADKKQNGVFIKALSGLHDLSISVLHGNPYIKLNISDLHDGSTYRILVLSEDSMVITPLFKSSIASLNRLYNAIGEKFSEGEIVDYREYMSHV